MRVRVLGSLDLVGDDGRPRPVAGARRRALLAALVVGAGRVVSVDRLVDAVWPDDPPPRAVNAVQVKVSELRRMLGQLTPHGRELLVSDGRGYRLRLDGSDVDAGAFLDMAGRGRQALSTDPAEARRLLADALALWRGPAFAELAEAPFALAAVRRWDAARDAAVRDRIEADLALGHGEQVVPELQALAAANPYDERVRGLLMLALARGGRQAEALEQYGAIRRLLADQLGVEPGAPLREQFQVLLRQQDVPPSVQPARPAARPLPAAATTFVGRDTDLGTVLALTVQHRLLTLTGPGGVGKTRLAVEAANRLLGAADAPPDGAAFVELGPLRDGRDLPAAVAAAIGLALPSGADGARARDLQRHVLVALSARRLLLVLDNCEHLVDEVAAFVQRLLPAAAGVRLILTSREVLGVVGEAVWSVPSLTVPPAGTRTLAAARRHGAARLFLDRATPPLGREPTDDDVPAVVALCRALDGIPLALELAAARVRAFGVGGLVERLSERLDLLALPRSASPRQRTLRAVVDWSWRLLDDRERRVLRRLAVFPDAFTALAATAVAAFDAPAPGGVEAVLASLLDKSLLQPADTVDRPGYRLLETVRTFALERLQDAGEVDPARDRHAVLVEDLVAAQSARLRSADQRDAAARLRQIHPDARAALSWAVEHRPDRAARLAAELGWYWYLFGHRQEGRRWLAAALAAHPSGTWASADVAYAAVWLAFLELDESPPGAVAPRLEAALDAVERAGSPRQRVVAFAIGALLADVTGDLARAQQRRAKGRDAAAAAGDPTGPALMDFLAGRSAAVRGDAAAGTRFLRRALDGFTATGDLWGQVQCLVALAALAEAAGDHAAAADAVRRALPVAEGLDVPDLRTALHTRAAGLALAEGDLATAQREVTLADAIARQQRLPFLTAMVAEVAGRLELARGDLDAAERRFRTALDQYDAVDAHAGVATVLGRLGDLARRRGRLADAAALLREALQRAEASGDAVTIAAHRASLEGLTRESP